LTPLDTTLALAYMAGAVSVGAWLGRGARTAGDYFLGGRDIPWPVAMMSIVATETSTLTFLSIPGVAYAGGIGFLQITFGYLAGRIAVAAWLLPAYSEGRLETAYALLETHFGIPTRRTASVVFMVTRLLADSVRLFATAIPLALITGWSIGLSVAAIGAATFVYTCFGGLRSVVWVDSAQLLLYISGGITALVVIAAGVPGGLPSIVSGASEAGKLALFDFSLDFGRPYTIWAGLVGGACLSMASHGTDQLMVQRLLSCRGLGEARRALVGSGLAVIAQFALFLLVGAALWVHFGAAEFESSDEIFARFIVEDMPSGLRGLLVAGVLAAAMSTLSSSINSLSSAAVYDLGIMSRLRAGGRGLLAGRLMSVAWTIMLILATIAFIPLSRGSAAVEVALSITSLVYGGLLGVFGLALIDRRAGRGPGGGRAARTGMLVGIGATGLVWSVAPEEVAWTWLVVIGAATTLAVAGGVRALGGDRAGGRVD